MLFNSFNFWLIFPLIFVIYWSVPNKLQVIKKWFLICVSYLLYMNYKPIYALVLLFVTLVTYWGGILFSNYSELQKTEKKKVLCSLFAILTLAPLILFKYYNFINNAGTELLEFVGVNFTLPGLNWAIPVGISFFTFQALGYMWDVYYGKIAAERHITDYILFCSFFPQTASGPISKYSELMPQIKATRPFRYEQGVEGLKILLWGMFLKCVVADRLGLYVDTVYSNYERFSSLNCFTASIFYTFQIYGDFAGYSFMAIGIGKILGFDLPNNFERPYLANSITIFWRKWHITLTRWLTAYVYIPLGGSRCSKLRKYWNIMLTFIISGLWHGANWTFIIWGMLHGIFQIIEKMLGLDPKGKYGTSSSWLNPIRILFTFLLVNFAWIFFRMPTFDDAYGLISQILNIDTSQPFMAKACNSDKFFSLLALSIILAVEIREEYLRNHTKWLDKKVVRFFIYVILFCMILSTGVLDASSFIYVNF